MVLKDYQRKAINSLEKFLELLSEGNTLQAAYKICAAEADIVGVPYRNNIAGVPQVCFKVPTGGGKTFMAAASLKPIHRIFPSRIVVWIVPSETILTQTYKNLSDAAHPYRRKITADFNGQVRVYTKEQLLAGENFSPIEVDEQLSILVLSYDSFRRKNKDGYKVYQENSHLNNFAAQITPEDKLADAEEDSLINTIRHYKPIVIVDESHHATTTLSVEMLKNFNPSFILELTATPKDTSNVISFVPARELKDEGMVKLPLVVYNQHMRGDVIRQAISIRNRLERYAANETTYIRPIVLFQAESKGKEDRATFDKIRDRLIKTHKIPAEEIAIKTATINELKGVDLLSKDCPIRYIITINALKEGWDCPFAYVLASLANRSSAVDVEQIVGRILRRPYTKNFTQTPLNLGYVLTSSDDFRATLNVITEGLNAAGFSEKEYRAVEELQLTLFSEEEGDVSATSDENAAPTDNADNAASAQIDTDITPSDEESIFDTDSPECEEKVQKVVDTVTNNLFDMTFKIDDDYKNKSAGSSTTPKSHVDAINEFPMQKEFQGDEKIVLPQFFLRGQKIFLFGDGEDEKVSREVLCKECTLTDKDAEIDFDDIHREIVSFDFHDNSNRLKYKYLSERESKDFAEHFDALPTQGKIRQCAGRLSAIINRHRNFPREKEVREYVKRVLSAFDVERLRDTLQHAEAYARRIEQKIDEVLAEYATKNFFAQVDARKIFAKPNYEMPATITPSNFTKNMAKTLYTAEADDMNNLEYRIISQVSALDNVRWWHRNRAKKEFFINGFINHYPDFMIMTESGVLLLVEVKGDDRDNSDSRQKLNLGKLWESKSNSERYGYFMVFDRKPLEGALDANEFVSRVKAL